MSKKKILLLVSALLIITVGTGSTVAFLSTQTQTVENAFEPAIVTTRVDEPEWHDGDSIKENVTIANTGNVTGYIRAAIVVSWTDENGRVIADSVPEPGLDYEMSIGDAWTLGADGYYYYNSTVAPGDSTTNLINRCEVYLPYFDDVKNKQQRLTVTVLADGVQAEGMGNSVTDAQSAFAKAASGV